MRVPAEFVGLARVFWNRIEAAMQETDRIHAASVRRCAQLFASRPGKPFRADHMIELENLWRSFPQFGTLLPLQVTRTKKTLNLRATRLTATHSTLKSWNGVHERNITLMSFGLDVTAKTALHTGGPLAVFGEHAVQRRYQRGFGPTDDNALEFDALSLLNHFHSRKVNADQIGERFSVPIAGVGEWLGVVRCFTTDDRSFAVLDVRTFS